MRSPMPRLERRAQNIAHTASGPVMQRQQRPDSDGRGSRRRSPSPATPERRAQIVTHKARGPVLPNSCLTGRGKGATKGGTCADIRCPQDKNDARYGVQKYNAGAVISADGSAERTAYGSDEMCLGCNTHTPASSIQVHSATVDGASSHSQASGKP